ncbi:bifunctional metallophosphatase/5'-nucleotidase [Niallia taxi]|uniref:bifunctional metallophosphatase/5'-nucleotidase n=1 Tax=Niallia taxi TaxID=2499688 RepID=UPI003D26A87E
MTDTNVTILFTSDVHGNIYPLLYGNNQPADVGLGKVATILAEERSKNEHTIVIDNGDLIQGTPLTYHYVQSLADKNNPMIQLLNKLQYDGAVIGNHEFNYGLNILQKAVNESDFPWLCANIVKEDTNEPFLGKPYIIKKIGEIKIAILGITTHYIPNWENPSNISGLAFRDALEAAKYWVERIKAEEQPQCLVVSYHGGFERDIDTGEPTEALTGENQGYSMCEQIDNMDVLLTGHQHRTLIGNINGVEIIQASNNGQLVGKVTLTFNDNGELTAKKAELLSTEGVTADASILNLASEYEQSTQHWLDTPIGFIDGDMTVCDPMETRLSDSPLIEFINKVQMEAAGVKIANTALFNNDSPGFKPNVTMRDIVSNYIYKNTLKVLSISGKDIKEALEQSAKYFEVDESGNPTVNKSYLYPKPQHYNYDMWEGIDYVLDISKPVGKRVVKLQYEGRDMTEDEQFEVVMNNYRAGGGGNYFMYQNKPVLREIQFDMSELIANYILERKTVTATCDHNWKVIW